MIRYGDLARAYAKWRRAVQYAASTRNWTFMSPNLADGYRSEPGWKYLRHVLAVYGYRLTSNGFPSVAQRVDAPPPTLGELLGKVWDALPRYVPRYNYVRPPRDVALRHGYHTVADLLDAVGSKRPGPGNWRTVQRVIGLALDMGGTARLIGHRLILVHVR